VLTGATLLLCSGCGGFRGSHSVSPATFLLPGLGSTAPAQAPVAPCETNGVPVAPQLASLN